MITSQDVQQKYSDFKFEAYEYQELQDCMDQQFKDCILAGRLGCQIPRDILPFCGKILKITQFVFDKRNEYISLFDNWSTILKTICQDGGIEVERYGVPSTRLNFPLSRAILEGKNVTFDKVLFLDSSNEEILEKIIEQSLRLTEQSCGYSVFSEKSLRMMLKAENTLCAYSTTVDGCITAVIWGVKLQIKQVPCFYMMFAAREPEYCGQHIYEKIMSAFLPYLVNEGPFKSEFLCWKQGKNNTINNDALSKFKEVLGEVSRTDGDAYTFEVAENCALKLNQHATTPVPDNALLESALMHYALDVGDFATFVCELPILMVKTAFFWNAWYSKTFPKPNGYPTTLQPI